MTLERLRVAVVRGGTTGGYEHSLQTGEAVLRALRQDEACYAPMDILVDRSGTWHAGGLPTDPTRSLRHVDLVWSASPQSYEDGRLERLLEAMQVPYVGSHAVSTGISESIAHTRDIYAREKLPTTRYALLKQDTYADSDLVYVFRNYLHPVTVRVAERGSKFGSRVVRTFQELEEAVKNAFNESKEVVVEEYIKGKSALLSIIENARGEKHYTLLPAEARDGSHIAPGNFTPEEKRRMTEMARQAHTALGLRHYSASRFIVTPKSVYILETLALPELYADSALCKSLHATGWKERDFVEHIIDIAR